MHANGVAVDRLSGIVIGIAFRAMNELGAGFADKVYGNDLGHECARPAWRSRNGKRLPFITTVSSSAAHLGVMNGLGAGFAEKVYGNALGDELREAGLAILQRQVIAVHYGGTLS